MKIIFADIHNPDGLVGVDLQCKPVILLNKFTPRGAYV